MIKKVVKMIIIWFNGLVARATARDVNKSFERKKQWPLNQMLKS